MITTVAGNTPVDVEIRSLEIPLHNWIFLLWSTVVPRVRSWKIRQPWREKLDHGVVSLVLRQLWSNVSAPALPAGRNPMRLKQPGQTHLY